MQRSQLNCQIFVTISQKSILYIYNFSQNPFSKFLKNYVFSNSILLSNFLCSFHPPKFEEYGFWHVHSMVISLSKQMLKTSFLIIRRESACRMVYKSTCIYSTHIHPHVSSLYQWIDSVFKFLLDDSSMSNWTCLTTVSNLCSIAHWLRIKAIVVNCTLCTKSATWITDFSWSGLDGQMVLQMDSWGSLGSVLALLNRI